MSIFINTEYRTPKAELMDDFSIYGAELRDTLDKLAIINRWLGGNKVTLNGLKKVLKDHPKNKPVTLVDLGCGGGDLLRLVAEFGNQNGFIFKIIGIDANEDAVEYARTLTQRYPEIQFLHCDIFSEEFKLVEYDLVLTTLFLHHFNEDQLVEFLPEVLKKASMGIIVNDLHRHPMAYHSFKLLSSVIKNKMVIEDGLTSVLKGFKREELERISGKIGAKSQIKWKWAFRYQWIIQNK